LQGSGVAESGAPPPLDSVGAGEEEGGPRGVMAGGLEEGAQDVGLRPLAVEGGEVVAQLGERAVARVRPGALLRLGEGVVAEEVGGDLRRELLQAANEVLVAAPQPLGELLAQLDNGALDRSTDFHVQIL